jgi:hypothetical protein
MVTAIQRGEGVTVALRRALHQVGVGRIPRTRTIRSHLVRDCSWAGKSSTDHGPLDEVRSFLDGQELKN